MGGRHIADDQDINHPVAPVRLVLQRGGPGMGKENAALARRVKGGQDVMKIIIHHADQPQIGKLLQLRQFPQGRIGQEGKPGQ